MDSIDIQILSCLKENARINASMIGERISMSVSAVSERIKKLESSGVIRQYTIMLEPKQVGQEVAAYISVSLEHPTYCEGFVASVKQMLEISECHYTTGDFDYLLKVSASSTEHLTNILNEVKSIQGVSVARTMVVLSTEKNEVCILPTEDLIRHGR